MARMIIEKSTIADGDELNFLIGMLKTFMDANHPQIKEKFEASKTAVSTVQADGATTGPTELTSALSDFVTDVVAVNDYVTILKSDEEANIGTWRITEITDLNTLVIDGTLVADTGMSFTVDRGRSLRDSRNDMNIHFLP